MKHIIITMALLCVTTAMYADELAAYRLNVQHFKEITVVDGVSVDYHCRPDSSGWAVFYCTPEIASEIQFENKSDKLTVRTAAEDNSLKGIPTIRLYSSELTKIENSGDSLVRVYSPTHVDRLKISQIGNGKIEAYNVDADNVEVGVTAGKGHLLVTGKAEKAKIKNVSAGPIDASGLLLRQANCYLFGTGDINCSPSEQLRVYGAGSGKVYYHVKPAKITNRGIGVKTMPKEEATKE